MQETIIKSDYELERGKPMPSKNHGIIQGNLYFELRKDYYDKYEIIPEVKVVINNTDKVPDLALFEEVEYTPGQDEIKLNNIPVLAIEILSPKQSLADLIAKSYAYFQAGVKSYWLVLPDLKTIYVYSGIGEYEAYVKKGMLKDDNLNISIDIAKVFAEQKRKKK